MWLQGFFGAGMALKTSVIPHSELKQGWKSREKV
jgi:hypothetical protein